MTSSPSDGDVTDELTEAATELEALTTEVDTQASLAARLEAALDTILDDPHLLVCLVDGDLRVQAVSRGMAARWSDPQPVAGQAVEKVAPSSWRELGDLVRSASSDRWTERPVEGGTLQARRITDPDADGLVVLRFVGR